MIVGADGIFAMDINFNNWYLQPPMVANSESIKFILLVKSRLQLLLSISCDKCKLWLLQIMIITINDNYN